MKILHLILSACIISGCTKKEQESQQTSNKEIKVELLFIHDGIKVYRFRDGRAVYYTDARGKTQWDETHSNGKSSWTEQHEVETEQ